MRRGVFTGIVLLSITMQSACAAFVDKVDYADYRRVRLADNSDERLLAIQHYVATHPEGHWHDELNAEQRTREADVYEAGKATRDGLAFYVRAYPSGRFAAQARTRLSVIAQVDQRKAEERVAAERAAAEKRVRDEELRRTWVTRFFGYWTDTLLAIRQWGEPIGDIARLNPEFSRAFGKSPRPQCNATECVKHYRANFGVPVPGGTRTERTIELTLRLLLRDGRVTRAELLFPRRGFSRWFEIENRRAVVDEDPEQRAEAIAWVIEKVKPWLAKVGQQRVDVSDQVFEPVLTPTLGPSGEMIDTTADNPNTQVSDATADDSVPTEATLGEPVVDQPAPDMIIGPITIPVEGHRLQTAPAVATSAPTTEGAGEIMTLGAIEVGDVDGTQTSSAELTTPTVTSPTVTLPVQLFAVASNGVRVILFAESPGGWDGLRIEKVPAPPPAATTSRVRRPR